jgi:hypothetical protein
MGSLIDDEILDTFAIVAAADKVAAKVRERYEGVVDRVMLTLPPRMSDEVAATVLESFRD